MPTSKKKKNTPRYAIFRSLSGPRDKMLVAKYGPYAIPVVPKCKDGSESEQDEKLRVSVFGYVLEFYLSDQSIKGIDYKLHLYQCLVDALRIGNGDVFKHVAKSIEVIAHAHTYGWYRPDAVRLLAEYYPRHLKVHPSIWEAWGEDMAPTAREVITKYEIKHNDTTQIRRLAAALGIRLRAPKNGRPSKGEAIRKRVILKLDIQKALGKELPKQTLPTNALPKKALPKKALPKKALPKKELPKALPTNVLPKTLPKKELQKKLPKKALPRELPKEAQPKKLPKKALPKSGI
jgi:hypothetical protein